MCRDFTGAVRSQSAPLALPQRVATLPRVYDGGPFPGHPCPGLIEAMRTWPARSASCSSPFPGHPCPGLIEAGGRPRGPRPGMSPFPGHPCPGLIEASSRRSALRRSPFPLFRGIRAPASLKLPGLHESGRRVRAFPGHPCPGLIEATNSATSGRRGSAPFPGHPCPGLIEATTWSGRSRGASAFPGHPCPGLIEAGLLLRGHHLPPGFSGASVPRPH